ncbi:MAG: BtpA/SgcQ family protein [Deltaproteobacteria bacterium]|nr:BtpA/SgcQ family protein [Deltaproteobacteria bacterium]
MSKHCPVAWCPQFKPIIGMLHAPPLPGSHRFGRDWAGVVESVLGDAQKLVEGGLHALLLENFGDAPFYPGRVPPETVAHMTRLATEVRAAFDVPLGINVLRNDAMSGLAIAAAVGAAFIRVNVLAGARVTDQGLIQGSAHDVLRARRNLHAEHIDILADVDVKHSAPLADRPIEEEAFELVHRAGAGALIVSGPATGQIPRVADLQRVRAALRNTPVFIGSGTNAETLAEMLPRVDGLIIGTALKQDGDPTRSVDPDRVCDFMHAIDAWQVNAQN